MKTRKKESIEKTAMRLGQEAPVAGLLEAAIQRGRDACNEAFGEKAEDPIAKLFQGIRFRNNHKLEAVRRVREAIEQAAKQAYANASMNSEEWMDSKNTELKALRREIWVLQRAIRLLHGNHAEQLIAASQDPYQTSSLVAEGKVSRG